MHMIRLGGLWFNGFVWQHPGTEPRGQITPTFDRYHGIVVDREELDATVDELRKLMPMANPIVHTLVEAGKVG